MNCTSSSSDRKLDIMPTSSGMMFIPSFKKAVQFSSASLNRCSQPQSLLHETCIIFFDANISKLTNCDIKLRVCYYIEIVGFLLFLCPVFLGFL
jgi:hypothetical protein